VDGARGIITEVAWRRSWRWMGRCDGLHQTLLSQFAIFIVLGHKGHLVISFLIKGPQGLVKRIKHSAIPLPPPSQSCFLRGVGVLHGVREEMRESEISLQSSKEWEDVVAVSAPCKLLICINIFVCLSKISSYLVLQCFSFLLFSEVFLVQFVISWFEEFFVDSFYGFGCYDEPHHLPPTMKWIHSSSPFDLVDFSRFPQNLDSLSSPKIEEKSLDLEKTLF
jgi:hypothetical protein